ncbi:hypothetical protein EV421DRAFT_1824902 [Armillaria borealis]|uniref:Uncharacterized protein n=1 Tax=Armillaria borealis TaxID=47425 RepID=A0AA39JAP6_9AGAR|nr:hypothetical protein EV421DRAFT_1824902 [Armillaria borealis]
MHSAPTPQNILDSLATSSGSFLVSSSSLQSSSSPPKYATSVISPMKQKYNDILSQQSRTELEASLQKALRESDERNTLRKGAMIGMQATAVLQNIYVSQSQLQLQSAEEKGTKKRGGIMEDGMPKMMTGDDFFNVVTAHEKAAEEAKKEKARCALLRNKKATAMVRWTREDKQRVERNNKKRECFHQAVLAWQNAKKNGHSTHKNKPKLADFGEIEKPFPKYTQAELEALSTDDEDSEEEEEEEEISVDDGESD